MFARRDCLSITSRSQSTCIGRHEKDTYSISESGRFMIHFDLTGDESPSLIDENNNGIPDYVDEVAIIADSARHVLVDIMGFTPEPLDEDGLYDIYIKSYSSGVYGWNCPDSPSQNVDSTTSYLLIDNDYIGFDSKFDLTPIEIMRISVAHEYFHGIQWGYEKNLGINAYFYEMTAMWFEDVLVPDGNDYLDGWADVLLNYPTVEFNNTGRGYELALFGHYLSSFIDPKGIDTAKNSTIIREMWERYGSTNSNAFYAVEYVLENNYDISFIETWIDFISRNLYNGIYENMDNPFYYYIDQSIVDPIRTTTTLLLDNADFELELDNESAAIESFRIGSMESIFTIEHGGENYSGRVAIVSSNKPELNNLFWGSDTTLDESYSDVKVHFIYGIDGSSVIFPIEITVHTVPLPPSNLMAVAAQDSIILSWNPSPGPGEDLSYVIYREGDSIGISIDTNHVDKQSIEAGQPYTYKVTCRNDVGESSASNTISVTSWLEEEDVISSKIINIYPNPIGKSHELTILYALDSDYSNPIIDLINVRGEVVNSINLSSFAHGWHRENIHHVLNNNPSSGIYFIRLQHAKVSGQAVKITILN